MNKDKEFLLRVVRDLSSEELFNAMKEGIVTFEELQDTGDFSQPKQIEFKKKEKEWEQKKEYELKAWSTALKENTEDSFRLYITNFPKGIYLEDAKFKIENLFWTIILQRSNLGKNDYQSYLNRYPQGEYARTANERIQAIQRKEAEERQSFEYKLKNRPDSLTGNEIKKALKNGYTSDRELINHYQFTQEMLNMISDPLPYTADFNWTDLAPLALNHTDVYFLGIVSSGKTCVIAGLLYYVKRFLGALNIKEHNAKGLEYANALVDRIRNGITPPPTAAKYGLNYIDLDFYSTEKRFYGGTKELTHPINLVEIPGETFEATYETGSTQEKETIGANAYLSNANDKIIYLVIDYGHESSDAKIKSRKDQGAQLGRILNLLANDGTLEKARGVYLLLTKADQLPNGVDDLNSAKAFIDQEFKDLRENLRRLSSRYDFDTRLINFSLGDFRISEFFTYDPKSSKVIYDSIVNIALTVRN